MDGPLGGWAQVRQLTPPECGSPEPQRPGGLLPGKASPKTLSVQLGRDALGIPDAPRRGQRGRRGTASRRNWLRASHALEDGTETPGTALQAADTGGHVKSQRRGRLGAQRVPGSTTGRGRRRRWGDTAGNGGSAHRQRFAEEVSVAPNCLSVCLSEDASRSPSLLPAGDTA